MRIEMQGFSAIEIEGERYDHDLVIEGGRIRKRTKGPSKVYRAHYGHTPLSAEEAIPWQGKRLYIGTGLYGGLPVMPEVYAAAAQRHIEVVALPTPELCARLKSLRPEEINAVLHLTC